jgi:hypothetical protein
MAEPQDGEIPGMGKPPTETSVEEERPPRHTPHTGRSADNDREGQNPPAAGAEGEPLSEEERLRRTQTKYGTG